MTEQKMLSITDLQAGYGGEPVLQGVSLGVQRGEIAAVIGRNGAGKSTLMRALIGLLPARRGRITLDGRDIHVIAGGEARALWYRLHPAGPRRVSAPVGAREPADR